MDRSRKTKAGLRHAVVCPNVTGRTKERIAQSGLVLVRSPLLTSHKWRELVPSGLLACRCHDVFLWCYVCFALLRFRLYASVEAAALYSAVLRYAGAPIATRVSFSFLGGVAFSEYLFVPFPLCLCMDSTSYVLSFRMVFFYLVTTGWIFDISLCENSIKQSMPYANSQYALCQRSTESSSAENTNGSEVLKYCIELCTPDTIIGINWL